MNQSLRYDTAPWRILVGLMVVLLIAFVLGCSDDDDEIVDPGDIPPSIDTIDTAGGAMTYQGEFTLIIPRGALDTATIFQIDLAPLPPDPPSGLKMVSSAYEVGPSGTHFDQQATISIPYDEEDLGGVDESSLAIYTHDGTGWSLVSSTVVESANLVTANIWHLSLFGVFADTTEPIFAEMAVARMVSTIAGSPNSYDQIVVRFDSAYAPCEPVHPLQADSVRCNEYELEYDEDLSGYRYSSMVTFIELGDPYVFEVVGSDEVHSMKDSIDFPTTMPYITAPDNNATVSADGFGVTWTNSSSGNVLLVLMPSTDAIIGSDTAFMVETANDGSYNFTADDLSGVTPGEHALIMVYENVAYIDADGYDERSFMRARVISTNVFNIE